MARPTLEELKALFKNENEKKNNRFSGNNNVYPFWQMGIGDEARVRILPDKNEDNPNGFYIDKLEHTLSVNGTDKKIACLKMYEDDCPICDISKKYYKLEGKGSTQGKYYYRNKASLVRVLVTTDPLPADEETGETFEGKVVNTQFGYQLMEKIREEIASGDLDAVPFDIEEGYDFKIKKSAQGDYGTYAIGSGFGRQSAIPKKYMDVIELIDLSTLLPENPGREKVEALLSAHLTGDDYSDDPETEDSADDADDADDDSENENVRASTTTQKTAVKNTTVADADDMDDADAILAEIKRRRAASKTA